MLMCIMMANCSRWLFECVFFAGTDIGCYVFIDIGMHYQRISLGDIRRHRVEESDLVFHSILRPPYKKGTLWFYSALWCYEII